MTAAPQGWSRAERGAIARPALRVLQEIVDVWNVDRAARGLAALSLDDALLRVLTVVRDDVVAGKAKT